MPFNPDAPPVRPGDYTRFAVKRASTLPPSTGATVAIPFTDAWGPVNTPTLVGSFQEYLDVFGRPVDPAVLSEGHLAVYNAFKGESEQFPGAGAVLCYRQGGAAVAPAARILAAGVTVNALTVTAKFSGTRGNNYKIGVADSITSPGTKRDVSLFFGTLKLHTWSDIGAADIAGLVATINRVASKHVVATGGTNGTVLDVLVPTNLTGGNDGTALVAADWTTTRNKLEPFSFGYFAPANLVDASILASLAAWHKALNAAEKAKRFWLVVGGALNETFSAASARSATLLEENTMNLGVGSYRDKELGLVFSSAQLATRLAGIASSRGGSASLSFAYLEDLEIVQGPTETEVLNSLEQGVIVIGLGTGGAHIVRGVTTYTTQTDLNKPFSIYSKVKWVTTMQRFEREGKEANENGRRLGRLPVNDDTREFLVGEEQKRLDAFVLATEVQPGSRVFLTTDPAPTDNDEHIAIDWVGKFGRSLEQTQRTIYFS